MSLSWLIFMVHVGPNHLFTYIKWLINNARTLKNNYPPWNEQNLKSTWKDDLFLPPNIVFHASIFRGELLVTREGRNLNSNKYPQQAQKPLKTSWDTPQKIVLLEKHICHVELRDPENWGCWSLLRKKHQVICPFFPDAECWQTRHPTVVGLTDIRK